MIILRLPRVYADVHNLSPVTIAGSSSIGQPTSNGLISNESVTTNSITGSSHISQPVSTGAINAVVTISGSSQIGAPGSSGRVRNLTGGSGISRSRIFGGM